MYKKNVLTALAGLIFTGMASHVWAAAVYDAKGNAFDIDHANLRAATIVPSVTEMVYAIGAEDNLACNSRYCRFPQAAKSKPKIGGFMDPNYELIAIIKPDIFILPQTSNTTLISKLEELKIKCFFMNKEGLKNLPADYRALGRLFGKEGRAEELAAEMEALMREGKNTNFKIKKAALMFDRMAAGKGSYAGDALEACGLANCMDGLSPWPVPSKEFIIAADPEILIVELKAGQDKAEILKKYAADPVWKHTSAVKNGRVYFIDSDLISIPGPRMTAALKEILKIGKAANETSEK